VAETSIPDAQIAFFNASEYVQSQLASAPYEAADILMDQPDTTFEGHVANTLQNPLFSNGAGLYQFPSTNTNGASVQSWQEYLRTTPGLHTITLTDTGAHHPLVTNQVQTAPGLPVTLYYSDSICHFRTFVCRDAVNETPDAAQLRVFDLSPDAGNVFFKIDSLPATGFADTLQYGTITHFTPWKIPAATTLQIYFYAVGNTTNVLATAPLSVLPGHAYNIIFTGYASFESGPDPFTGRWINFFSDLRIILTQNN
jgi:hypothetical protein